MEAPLGGTEEGKYALPPLAAAQTTVAIEGGQMSVGVIRTPATYKENVERTRDDPSALSFPSVLTLLEDDGATITKERIAVYTSILI